jgi:hypothetical protein
VGALSLVAMLAFIAVTRWLDSRRGAVAT